MIIVVLLSFSGITASALTVTYTYDSDGQLLKAAYSSGESLTYAYDAAGNILTRVVAGGIPQTFALTVSISGSGAGTVTSDPTGISCGAMCSTTYNEATGVTLTATPDTGSSFTGWSGACSGTGSCVLTMDGAKTVIATFILNPIDGACGAANGQVVAIAPVENLCSAGTATSVNGAGPWTWNCDGANGGTTASDCRADLIGACGSADGETYAEAPTDFLCSTGTATDVTYSVVGDDSTPKWTWQCKGTDGVSKVDCSANKQSSSTVINGACGSANDQVFMTKPATNLCSDGTASAVSGSNPWTWNCAGANGGVTIGCSTYSQAVSGIKGDVNNDQAVTLADAILALQILSGMTPAPVNPAAGVNSSGRIGLTEALFALQKVALLREAAVDPGVVTGTKSISVASQPPFYGFTFASGSVAQMSGDFMVTGGSAATQSVSGMLTQGMMQNLGLIASLADVTQAPESGYTTPQPLQLTAGHAYAFQLTSGKYAIIVVKSVGGSPVTMTFDYKYQPSGSRTF